MILMMTITLTVRVRTQPKLIAVHHKQSALWYTELRFAYQLLPLLLVHCILALRLTIRQ
jgi:hypothetical protein